MSLLIDALRKAEKDRENAGGANDDLEGLALEPISGLDDAPPTLPPDLSSDQQAAANLFEVNREPAPQNRLVWLAVAGVIGGLVIGAYVWWQMQPVGSILVGEAPRSTTRAPRSTPATQALDDSRPTAPRTERIEPPGPTVSAPVTARVTSAAPAMPKRILDAERGNLGIPPTPAAAPPKPTQPPPVRLTRTRPAPVTVPAKLSEAYQAYQAGRLKEAELNYRDYLRFDPNNTDALNGLGAIAMRENRLTDAQQWFQRALTANPADAVALTGLASLNARGDSIDLARNARGPFDAAADTATSHFASGNALAAQGRWAEAQSAYFEAHTADPQNPDYLFNLAVSLDQLAQPALARDYYRRALDAAAGRPAAFDTSAAQTRLAQLQEVRP